MAYNETVNIDINANTTDAQQSVDKLENNIKTLDGAINLVGGSIEVLAGTLALTGAVTEEQAERFQTAAVGAIALADGSKRMIEGYKTLATETKALTVVQRIYNNVIKANPYIAAAVALAALTAAIVLIVKRTREANEEEQKANGLRFTTEQNTLKAAEAQNAYNRSLEAQESELENSIKLLKAQGGSIDDVFEAEKRLLELRIAARRDEANELQRQVDNINQAIQQFVDLGVTGPALNKLKEEKQGLLNEVSGIVNNLKSLQTDLQILQLDYIKELDEAEEDAYEEFEKRELKRREELRKTTQEAIDADVKRYQSAITTANKINNTEQKILDARIEIGQIGVEAFQEGLNAIFGESKGLAKAQVLIDAAQAAVGIIRKGTDPRNAEALVFPNAWIAANLAFLGATTAASIASINSANADGGGGAGGTNYGGGAPTLGGGGAGTSGIPNIPGFGTSGVTALNAVVLSGDVTSAQAQDAAIRSRRRFGRGG